MRLQTAGATSGVFEFGNNGLAEFYQSESGPRWKIWRDFTGFDGQASGGIGFAANGAGLDAFLIRDSADTMALRNGTGAQALNVYKTFTDSSNFERAMFSWKKTTDVLVIGTDASGTGVFRSVHIRAGTGDGNVGRVRFGQNNAAGLIELISDASASTASWLDAGDIQLTAKGDRTLSLRTDGDGHVDLMPDNAIALRAVSLDNAVTRVEVSGNTTGNAPSITGAGETNTGLTLATSGSGNLVLEPNSGDIRWNKALVALGGGASATLGTIGGSGPATATQNTWMRILDSTGAAFWVPAWK
jgi:hypothetical protein